MKKKSAGGTLQKPARTKRLNAEERRLQLIQTSLELFAKSGFEGTTTRQIAAEAGINEALIFRHFGNKEELYTAILDHKAREAGTEDWLKELEGFVQAGNDHALIRSLTAKILENYEKDPQFQRLMFFSALEGHQLSQIFHERRAIPIFNCLREFVIKRQKEGAFGPGDPGALVLAMVGIPTYYSIIRWLLRVNVLDAPRRRIVSIFTDLTLAALRHGATELEGEVEEETKNDNRVSPSELKLPGQRTKGKKTS